MTKILIADDERLVRQAIGSLLSLQSDFQIVGEAGNGQEALEMVDSCHPDVVLLDIQMPVMDGIKAAAAIKGKHPQMAILMLTTFDDTRLIVDALKSGAGGYLLKDSGSDEIAAAVRAVLKGYAALGSSVTPKLVSMLQKNTGPPAWSEILTPRELDVLKLLKNGRSNAEIAVELGIEVKTVRDHMANVMGRLNLRDRTQIALWANENLP